MIKNRYSKTLVTGADGYVYTTYTASDTGTATITATMESCGQWDDVHTAAESTAIEVYKCEDWELYIEMSFSHDPENWNFQDDIVMYIPIEVSHTGVVGSPGGTGVQSIPHSFKGRCIRTRFRAGHHVGK